MIGDGVVTVRADLADAAAASAVTAYGPAVFAGSAEPATHALAIPLVVIGLIVFGGIAVGVGAVALTSDSVHDALERFFGLGAAEPRCAGGPPQWVARVWDSDEVSAQERPRLHTCGESTGDDLRVKVVNNRNYGVRIKAAEGAYPVSMPGGNNPVGALDIAIKEAAEEFMGESYLWPLSGSEFRLPPQSSDWSGRLFVTAGTMTVDGVRLGLDLLKIVLPAIEGANDAGFVTCVRGLLDHVGRRSVDIGNHLEWKRILGTVASCFTPRASSRLSDNVRTAVGKVKTALGWASTAVSAVKWGLTFADVIKDSRVSDASISVSVKLDADTPAPPAPTWSTPR